MENFEERTERKLCEHDDRIRDLEIKEASQNERIAALCDKLEEFTKIIDRWMDFAQNLFWKVLGVAGGIIGILAGFFIWYVQYLGK